MSKDEKDFWVRADSWADGLFIKGRLERYFEEVHVADATDIRRAVWEFITEASYSIANTDVLAQKLIGLGFPCPEDMEAKWHTARLLRRMTAGDDQ